ncbi:MAG TPA: hypothetical protein VKN36_18550 [Eudoraea sp.]|nr:hypothetical protein [Eudoraea sp.]
MTLHNFEKQIKEKLRQREIRPSEDAWHQISSGLEKGKPRRMNYLRYGIAAGFIGMLIISVLYFKAEDGSEKEVQIVNSPPEKSVSNRADHVPEEEFIANTNKEHDLKNGEARDDGKPTKERPQHLVNSVKQAVDKESNPEVFSTKVKVSQRPLDQLIGYKVTEIIAQVNLLEKDAAALTDAEVDSLLRRAQRDILTADLLKVDGSVDAAALLGEVEDELDQSFRDQIFEKLKTGFEKVRTAVADRNN